VSDLAALSTSRHIFFHFRPYVLDALYVTGSFPLDLRPIYSSLVASGSGAHDSGRGNDAESVEPVVFGKRIGSIFVTVLSTLTQQDPSNPRLRFEGDYKLGFGYNTKYHQYVYLYVQQHQ